MSKCKLCDERGSNGIGGVLFCANHAAVVRETIDELCAQGESIDVNEITARMMGQKSIYIDQNLAARATQKWDGSFSSLVSKLLKEYVGVVSEKSQ